MSILSRFSVFLLFFLIGGTPIAASAARDPVIFFNARKYWGNIDNGSFGYNQKNEIIFLGRYYKKKAELLILIILIDRNSAIYPKKIVIIQMGRSV